MGDFYQEVFICNSEHYSNNTQDSFSYTPPVGAGFSHQSKTGVAGNKIINSFPQNLMFGVIFNSVVFTGRTDSPGASFDDCRSDV